VFRTTVLGSLLLIGGAGRGEAGVRRKPCKSDVRQDPGFAICNCGNAHGVGLALPVCHDHAT
jgi:hypothetical protein